MKSINMLSFSLAIGQDKKMHKFATKMHLECKIEVSLCLDKEKEFLSEEPIFLYILILDSVLEAHSSHFTVWQSAAEPQKNVHLVYKFYFHPSSTFAMLPHIF
jgi:hypothetical protein